MITDWIGYGIGVAFLALVVVVGATSFAIGAGALLRRWAGHARSDHGPAPVRARSARGHRVVAEGDDPRSGASPT